MTYKIDYSKYSIGELLEVKSHIDHTTDNYQSLIKELENRQSELIEYEEEKRTESFAIAEKRVSIIGYFQAITSLFFTYTFITLLLDSLLTFTNGLIVILIIAANAVAGYTAIREYYKFYWISVTNQLLQVFTFSLGIFSYEYKGFGNLYVGFSWHQDFQFTFTSSLYPNFSFTQYVTNAPSQSITFNLLALLFTIALLTVEQVKLSDSSSH